MTNDYIAGFVEGEGCFALQFRRDVRHERKGKPIYFYWKAEFVIVLRKDDTKLLTQIKKALECGSITFTKTREQVRYAVGNLDDLINKIIPFFKIYQFHGKKKQDFLLWTKAVNILHKYKIKRSKNIIQKGERGFIKTKWNIEDIRKLLDIQKRMSLYKSKRPPGKWINSSLKIGRG